MPPASISCSRDKLTMFTGTITSYQRTKDAIRLAMTTDWDSKEQFTIQAPFKMLLKREPFKDDYWKQVETSVGKLKAGTRVTVWSCSDGGQPVLDWAPIEEK